MDSGYYELCLDRSKINTTFDGYKLSLDSCPITSAEFSNKVDIPKLSNDNYTYQNIKLFGLHNSLYHDNYNPDNVYLVDDHWQILKFNMISPTFIKLSTPTSVFMIPDSGEKMLIPGRVPVTMHFPSEEYVVIADGASSLFILKSGNRNENAEWKEVYKGEPLGNYGNLMISYSSQHVVDHSCFIEVITVHVSKQTDAGDYGNEKQLSNNSVFINWFSFVLDVNQRFSLARQRTFESGSVPDYLCINANASAFLAACERPVKISFDSLKEIVHKNGETKEEISEPDSIYTWTQNPEDITLSFKLPAGTSKSEIICDIGINSLNVKLASSDLLCGDLLDDVVVGDCTWMVDDKSVLEITLHKLNKDFDWPSVVKNDSRGERIYDDDQIESINNRLAPYTSENGDTICDMKAAFNVQQIEDCDSCSEHCMIMYCFDGETHQINQQVDLSNHQFLFSNRDGHQDRLPILCLRHDVDGVVWRPVFEDSTIPKWVHDSTFDALGYVQASKQQKKFTACSPDYSYVSIVDCQRHAYIYRRQSPIPSPLRNRKTGEVVSTVAKQQVISLETNELVEGAVVTNSRLFLVVGGGSSSSILFSVRINSDK